MSQDLTTTVPRAVVRDTGTSPRFMAVGAVVLTTLMVWVFWDFLAAQVRWAYHRPADWGHTLVIPFIAGYFAWMDRERLVAKPFRTAWPGLILVLVGVFWYLLCVFGPQPLAHHNLRGAGFAVTLAGLIILLLGWRAFLILLFPLAYLVVFGQTISERLMNIVTFRMQDIAAAGSHVILNVIGVDTDRSGNTLTIHHNGVSKPLNIAEACSGMRMLVAFLALGVAIAYTGLPRVWQRVVLVLLGIPVAIFVNMLRVVTLGVLSLFDVEFAAGEFHTMIGLLWLVPAFLLYLGLMWILRNLVIDERSASPA
ncbi:MAG: exosortase/archaeosortase family protein [Phycisphaerales bacterium]|nr:exosortase/archaeosortase family protein [Phycisphaerales bacterium]